MICTTYTSAGGQSTITTDAMTLTVRKGRVIVKGRTVYHSEGAEFSIVFAPSLRDWLPERFSRPRYVLIADHLD